MRPIALVLAMMAMAPAPVQAQEDMTSRQLEALSPQAATRQAHKDLLSILNPVRKYQRGMFVGVHAISTTTRAHGTEFEGLCSRDGVTVWYAPTEAGRQTRNSKVRPYKVTATPWFAFVAMPLRAPVLSHSVWQDRCSALGADDRTEWFAARDAETAVRGALLFQAALDAVRAGTIAPKCDAGQLDAKGCAAWILEGRIATKPGGVTQCAHDQATECLVLGANSDFELTITAQRDGDNLAPGKILSVSAVQYIIVT